MYENTNDVYYNADLIDENLLKNISYYNLKAIYEFKFFNNIILKRSPYSKYFHLFQNKFSYPAKTEWYYCIYNQDEDYFHIYENTNVTEKINKLYQKFKVHKSNSPQYYAFKIFNYQLFAIKINKTLLLIDNTYIATLKISI